MSIGPSNPFDINLLVKDGKEFQAHRNVLSQASPFFEKLLNADMKENNEGVIRLEWISESQMEDILQFIYTGSVQISTQEDAENIIAAANYLLLSNLKGIAGKFFEQHTTIENCISIYYSVAEQYSCEDLIASTRKFINSNLGIVAAYDDFLNLTSHEVEKWISSDEIEIDAEENVFDIIVRWINHDKSERSGKFGELFRHVRLTTISREFLLSDVLTNDLVRENEDSFAIVTGALNWIDRLGDCYVPRPHSPRNALTKSAIVITCTDIYEVVHPCLYLPATGEWYRLPAPEGNPGKMVSYRGKLFSVPENISRSQCYDPDFNRWFPAPWTELDPNFSTDTVFEVLVSHDQICFIGFTALWIYSLDSNSLTPVFDWDKRTSSCAVAVDRYIYVIGGLGRIGGDYQQVVLSECSRFDTEGNEWPRIAPLNMCRTDAFGVCKNEHIFIAGGSDDELLYAQQFLKSCELYNIRRVGGGVRRVRTNPLWR